MDDAATPHSDQVTPRADQGAEPRAADDGSERRGGFLRFWTTLPGVLTGVAAVIAAVVSLVALFGTGRPGPAEPVAAETTASTGAGSTSEKTGTAPAAPGVAYRGTMTLAVDEFGDLAAGTVSDRRGVSSEFFLLGSGGYRLVAAIDQTLAYADVATREACVGALAQRQDRQLLLAERRGRSVCVLLGSQQVAGLAVTADPAVGSPRLAFDYVVWA